MFIKRSQTLFCLLLAGSFSLHLCGCSSEPGVQLAPVSGMVTRAGQPVANAIVEFFPSAGRASVGRTDENGAYVLKYSDEIGAVVGSCRVQITPGTDIAEGAGEDVVAAPMKAPPAIVKVPGTVEIQDLENFFNFELDEYQS